MKGTILLSSVLMFLISCGTKSNEKPGSLLSEEKLAAVLTEVELLDAVYTLEYQKRDTSRQTMAAYYEEVYQRHGVTREQFTESLEWYGKDPEKIRALRYKVYDELSRMQAELKSEAQRDSIELARRDSTVK
jgi:citrate synthase